MTSMLTFKLVIRVIRLEALNLERTGSLILNQSNIEEWNWKKKLHKKIKKKQQLK